LVLYFPDGSRHPLRLVGYNDDGDGYYQWAPNRPQVCPSPTTPAPASTVTYYTTDGTYITVFVSPASSGGSTTWSNYTWGISFPDGRVATSADTSTQCPGVCPFGTLVHVSSIKDHNGNTVTFAASFDSKTN